MMADFHFLRALWLLALIPLAILALKLWRQKRGLQSWDAVCDHHLLEQLVLMKGKQQGSLSLCCLLLSGFFLIISLSGPSWQRLPVPAFQPVEPRVVVLDLSDDMLSQDLSPDRLSRAKFKLHDLLQRPDAGQWGLVVYTGEPFVVSPLTEDGETIRNLLATLTPDIMPLKGHQLDTALDQAAQLISQAGYPHGQILVMTGTPPDSQAIHEAEKLASQKIHTSVIPLNREINPNPLYQQLADAGHGQLLQLTADSSDLEKWLNDKRFKKEFALSQHNDIAVWRDEGRWFLIPALLFLFPLFRRGGLQGIAL